MIPWDQLSLAGCLAVGHQSGQDFAAHFLLQCVEGLKGSPRDPCTQIIPTLGPKVCKYYLHWAIWIP